MAFFADLGSIDYFRCDDTGALRAIGWLTQPKEFNRGETSSAFFHRLCRLLVSSWEPAGWAFRGLHVCEMCLETLGPEFLTSYSSGRKLTPAERKKLDEVFERQRTLQFDGMTLDMGGRNLFVPGQGCIYVAPSLVAHYIDAHRYRPPEEFIQAVLRCPETSAEDYLQLNGANGGAAWPRPLF